MIFLIIYIHSEYLNYVEFKEKTSANYIGLSFIIKNSLILMVTLSYFYFYRFNPELSKNFGCALYFVFNIFIWLAWLLSTCWWIISLTWNVLRLTTTRRSLRTILLIFYHYFYASFALLSSSVFFLLLSYRWLVLLSFPHIHGFILKDCSFDWNNCPESNLCHSV